MRHALGLLSLSLYFIGQSGCGAPNTSGGTAGGTAGATVGLQNDSIIGGTTDTGDPSVVLVVAMSDQGEALCTGEVVSPHVVITAAHCVDPDTVGNNASFQIFLGADYNNQQQANDNSLYVDVSETHYDQQFDPNQLEQGHDIGVLITSSALAPAPLPMNRNALTQSDVGATIRFVGFGIDNGNDTQGTSAGTKRTVKTTITDYTKLLIDFTDGQHNTCEGDSGGPAFLTVNGTEIIVGITSFGDSGCTQGGSDTRIDVYASVFVDPYIQANDPTSTVVEVPDMSHPSAPPDLGAPPQAQPDLLEPPVVVNDNPDMATAPATGTGSTQGNPTTDENPDMAQPAAKGGSSTTTPTMATPTSGGSHNSGGVVGVNGSCGSNSDCASAACAQDNGEGYCTRTCSAGKSDTCPVGMYCGTIDSESYCIRNAPASSASSGCSIGGHASESSAAPLLALLMALSMLVVNRRARRS